MKIHFKIVKNSVVTHEHIADSQEAGDLWVAQNQASFGKGDRHFTAAELAQHGLVAEDAASSEEVPNLSGEGTHAVYFFPKDWSVETQDVTAALEESEEIEDRSKVRGECGRVIDMIAQYNKRNVTREQLLGIIGNPSYLPIIVCLLTGAPGSAKDLIVASGTQLYPQPFIDKIVAKLAALEAFE